MSRRILLAGAFFVAVWSLDGCFHRARIGLWVIPPRDLDSVATAKWVDAQGASCRGHLQLLFDEGAIRDLDGVVRYHSPLAGVQCIKP